MFQVHVFLGGLSGMGQGILGLWRAFLSLSTFPPELASRMAGHGVGNGVGTLAWSFGLEALLQEFGGAGLCYSRALPAWHSLFCPCAAQRRITGGAQHP